jgi:hypothetical protein
MCIYNRTTSIAAVPTLSSWGILSKTPGFLTSHANLVVSIVDSNITASGVVIIPGTGVAAIYLLTTPVVIGSRGGKTVDGRAVERLGACVDTAVARSSVAVTCLHSTDAVGQSLFAAIRIIIVPIAGLATTGTLTFLVDCDGRDPSFNRGAVEGQMAIMNAAFPRSCTTGAFTAVASEYGVQSG